MEVQGPGSCFYPASMPVVRALAFLALIVLGCAVPERPPPSVPSTATPPPHVPDVALPRSPVGERLTAWLHAVNDATEAETLHFYETSYARTALDVMSAKQRTEVVHRTRADAGRRRVRRVERATDFEIVVLVQFDVTEEWGRAFLAVDPTPPHLLVESRGAPADPPDGHPPLDDAAIAVALDAYTAKLVARELFSGSVAIAKNGKITYERAYGLASRAFGSSNRADTKFNLGSMNKMFTAVAIAQLVQAGKLTYTDPIKKHLPDYPNASAAEKITIHHLLTHTSGLADYFTETYEHMAKNELRAIADYFPLFVDKPLDFEPGAKFRYSNAGFMVLGAIVQRVSGEDYFEYMRRHVYAPAGMTSTDAYEMDRDTPNLAIGYTRDGSHATPREWQNNLFLHVVKGGPAGGGFSTVRDLARFADALAHGKLLEPAQVATVWSPKVDTGWGAGEKYGYGFTERHVRGVRYVGHDGGFSGINATLQMFPDLGVTIAVMANYDPPSAQRVGAKARDLVVP